MTTLSQSGGMCRDINPMYEGHMQHDAQEFLRCVQCYFQDAEKEVRKFYDQLPSKFSPRPLNPIMQRFLTIAQTLDKRLVNGAKKENINNNVKSEDAPVEKVKANLFTVKPEGNTQTAKSPSKVPMTPIEAETAGIVDQLASLPSACMGVIPAEAKGLTNGGLEADDAKSDVPGKAAKVTSTKRAHRIKPYEKVKQARENKNLENSDVVNSKIDLELGNGHVDKTYSNKKRLGMRGAVVKNQSEILFDELKELETKSQPSPADNNAEKQVRSEENVESIETKEHSQHTKDEDDSVKKSENAKKLECFQKAFVSFVSSSMAASGSNSDSDNEDIVAQKMRAKLLSGSPRRSPRKTKSDLVRPSPGKLPISRLALLAKSETDVLCAKTKLDFSKPPGAPEAVDANRNATSEINDNSINGSLGTGELDLKIKSEETGSVSEISENPVTISDCPIPKTLSKLSNQSLMPVVILENCDHVLSENGTYVCAKYASRCLTPRKPADREDSNNYLKQRTPQLPLEIEDELEFKKALEEMLNSPVKSRSKFDLVERNFQVCSH